MTSTPVIFKKQFLAAGFWSTIRYHILGDCLVSMKNLVLKVNKPYINEKYADHYILPITRVVPLATRERTPLKLQQKIKIWPRLFKG